MTDRIRVGSKDVLQSALRLWLSALERIDALTRELRAAARKECEEAESSADDGDASNRIPGLKRRLEALEDACRSLLAQIERHKTPGARELANFITAHAEFYRTTAAAAAGTATGPGGRGGDVDATVRAVALGEAKLKKWHLANKDKIEAAIQEQRTMLENKIAEVDKWDDGAKASFKKAFGTEDKATRKVVKERMERMLALCKTMTVDNFKPADPSKPNRFAYVYPDDATHTIYLDHAFQRAKSSGQDSRAGVLSHEMSHFSDIGGTLDAFRDYDDGESVYGPEASRALARSRPDLAAKHADSFEYYLENVL